MHVPFLHAQSARQIIKSSSLQHYKKFALYLLWSFPIVLEYRVDMYIDSQGHKSYKCIYIFSHPLPSYERQWSYIPTSTSWRVSWFCSWVGYSGQGLFLPPHSVGLVLTLWTLGKASGEGLVSRPFSVSHEALSGQFHCIEVLPASACGPWANLSPSCLLFCMSHPRSTPGPFHFQFPGTRRAAPHYILPWKRECITCSPRLTSWDMGFLPYFAKMPTSPRSSILIEPVCWAGMKDGWCLYLKRWSFG